MRILTIAIMLVFHAATISYAADAIYTWKDENGILNITDAPPPAGAEVIDVSPVTHGTAAKNKKKDTTQTQVGQKPSNVAINQEKQRLLDQAAEYRRQQEEAYQRGQELQAEIDVWKAKSGTKRKRRRNNRQIKKFNERIAAVNKEIETAGKKAEELEKKAASMK